MLATLAMLSILAQAPPSPTKPHHPPPSHTYYPDPRWIAQKGETAVIYLPSGARTCIAPAMEDYQEFNRHVERGNRAGIELMIEQGQAIEVPSMTPVQVTGTARQDTRVRIPGTTLHTIRENPPFAALVRVTSGPLLNREGWISTKHVAKLLPSTPTPRKRR